VSKAGGVEDRGVKKEREAGGALLRSLEILKMFSDAIRISLAPVLLVYFMLVCFMAGGSTALPCRDVETGLL
jgi:hypothetical protein